MPPVPVVDATLWDHTAVILLACFRVLFDILGVTAAFTLPPSEFEPAQGQTLEVSAGGRCEQDTPVRNPRVFPSSKPCGVRIHKVLEFFRSGKAGNLVLAFRYATCMVGIHTARTTAIRCTR